MLLSFALEVPIDSQDERLLVFSHLHCTTFESPPTWPCGRLEPDAATVGLFGTHEFADRVHQVLDIGIMTLQTLFQFRQLRQDIAVPSDGPTHTHKSKNDKHAHLDRAFRVQHGGGHNRTMFGKNVGTITRAAMAFP